MTLTEFLLARIAEDEIWARKPPISRIPLVAWDNTRIEAFDGSHIVVSRRTGKVAAYVIDDFAEHVARWDQSRVLAECEARRRIVDEHPRHDWLPAERAECARCGCADDDGVAWPCPTLKAIALPYADHPDYREEWRA